MGQFIPAHNSANLISNAISNKSNCKIIYPGDSLQTAYDWLKSSDRDGQMGSLSSTNRRVLILMPGVYTLTATLTLDTDGVDLIAHAPANGRPRDNSFEDSVNVSTLEASGFGPPPTYITSTIGAVDTDNPPDDYYATVIQTCNDVKLYGFGIVNENNLQESDGRQAIFAFLINCTSGDNQESSYDTMYFFIKNAGNEFLGTVWRYSVYGISALKGFWNNCNANSGFLRQHDNQTMEPIVMNCQFGPYSIGGDRTGVTVGGEYWNCIAKGTDTSDGHFTNTNGGACFGGCSTTGSNVSALLFNCQVGDRSVAMGATFSGEIYNCVFGDKCVGGGAGANSDGHVTGKIYGSRLSGQSLGCGSKSQLQGLNDGCEVVNTVLRDMPDFLRIDGAFVQNCAFEVTATDKSVFQIPDPSPDADPSRVYNCTLIANGTGHAVELSDSSTPQDTTDITIANCISNAGFGTNVTNTIGDASWGAGNNVTDSSISID